MAARVLLAEDNQPLALVLYKFLTQLKLDVCCAKTGIEAWELVQRNDYDLLVLDLKLPGLSGVELLRRLRGPSSRWFSLPIVIISGAYRSERHVEAARRLGVSHYLQKPFTPTAFRDAVQSVLPRAAVPGSTAQKPVSVRELLPSLYNCGKSGVVVLANGLSLSFINGDPVSFLSRGTGEFASFLVSRGRISLEDLRQFRESGQDRLFFTYAGLLTYDELVDESRHFLSAILTDALKTAKNGIFFPRIELESPLTPITMARFMYDILRNNADHSFHDADFLFRFGPLYPARTALFFRRANLTSMHREHIHLLEKVDGRTSLNEIIGQGDAYGAVAFFKYLFSFGMIDFHPAAMVEARPDFPQKILFNRPLEDLQAVADETVGFEDVVVDVSERVERVVGEEGMGAPLSPDEIGFDQMVHRDFAAIADKNYYEIFGISRSTFSFNLLKDAYFEKSRQYSPEKFMELSGQTLELAQEVLSHYANAYNTLSSVVAKERYDEMLNAGITTGLDGKQDDRLQASIQFQSGGVFLQMGEYGNAEKALQEAYSLEPDNAMHSALLAWAVYRNPANGKSRTSQEKARMLLGKSLQSGRTSEAFAFRGWMLLDEGREGLAEGEFQKALKLNPREPNACKGMLAIKERREMEKRGGLFRRIFS